MLGAGDGCLHPSRGARNMAVDHALMESVHNGASPVLRLYLWDPPTLSLGRNQRATNVYDPTRAAAAGIHVVRRPTGGLAVLHDRELTYCVLAPLARLGGARRAYASINDALVRALSVMGVAAERARGGRVRAPQRDTMEPCFQEPAAGEVVAGGRKLIGSAQRCEGHTLLQHGSILLDGTQSTVQSLLHTDERMLPSDGAVTLRELLGRVPAPDELADVVTHAFEQVFGIRLAPGVLTRAERARAEALESTYAAHDWTWRH